MMLPICLILLWAAIFQQKGATTATGGSLLCNNATNTTVEVEAGGNVTLCCTIDTPHHKDCEVKYYKLSEKSVPIRACNCGQEEETFFFKQSKNACVVISSVTENQNYTLTVFTTCGFELKHDIEVKVWNTSPVGGSLLCNNATNTTVEVEAGGNVTLCCTIDTPHHKCEVKNYELTSGKSVLIRACNCGQEEETCVFKQSKNVSLVISNVTENQNYTLNVLTTCGFELKHDIEVKVRNTSPVASPAPPLPVTGIVACVLLPLLLGIIVMVTKIRKRRTSSQDSRVY